MEGEKMMKCRRLLPLTLLVLGGFLVACGGNTPSEPTDNNNPPSQTIEWETEWSHDETHHWHAAKDSSITEVKDKAAHVWDNGKVTTPATEQATGVKTYTCTVCQATKTETIDKLAHVHVLNDGYSHDLEYHWKTCSGCSEQIEKAAHSGGTATCTEQAICEICHEAYGALADHAYGDLVARVAPTCEEDGHEAYYHC